jgi:hypothetical protein
LPVSRLWNYASTGVKQTDGNRSTSEPTNPVVFLVDVDNTLLDNDRIQEISGGTWTGSSGRRAGTGTGRYARR